MSPPPSTCRHDAHPEADSDHTRSLRAKIIPMLTAGIASGIARAVTAWFLDHVGL
ncbi:hypothetical protein [Micromonospora matsumotoense]|uniref:hypothetical protein n=1 Tax=Micromonospora matsumotoense TaxID=121616 RepID=UPI00340C2435